MTALTWKVMVIITKGGGDYREIGLVGVIWKVCALIMNKRLQDITTLHDALNGFIQGRGTATATMEAKLAQNLAGLCHETLFQVFLDVQKSYNYLDRRRCMYILRGYALGTNFQRLILQ